MPCPFSVKILSFLFLPISIRDGRQERRAGPRGPELDEALVSPSPSGSVAASESRAAQVFGGTLIKLIHFSTSVRLSLGGGISLAIKCLVSEGSGRITPPFLPEKFLSFQESTVYIKNDRQELLKEYINRYN